MTDCANGEVRDLLPDLLHERLTPAERQRVQAHVDGCAECRAELALLRGLRAAMHRVPAIDTGAVAATIPAYRAPARRSWASWRAAAAVALIAVGGASVALVQRGSGAHSDSTSTAAPTAVAVADPVATSGAAGTAGETRRVAAAPSHRELALASAAIGELDERELSTLVKDIEQFDAVPSAEVENGTAATPLSPRGDE
jgi:anti-sigma factor RsiW